VVLDGEVCAFDEELVSRFQFLYEARHARAWDWSCGATTKEGS